MNVEADVNFVYDKNDYERDIKKYSNKIEFGTKAAGSVIRQSITRLQANTVYFGYMYAKNKGEGKEAYSDLIKFKTSGEPIVNNPGTTSRNCKASLYYELVNGNKAEIILKYWPKDEKRVIEISEGIKEEGRYYYNVNDVEIGKEYQYVVIAKNKYGEDFLDIKSFETVCRHISHYSSC